MGIVTFVLGLIQPSPTATPLWLLWVFLIFAGIFGGFFLVPLQAMQQGLAVSAYRARVLGTANAISFLLMALGSFLYGIVVQFSGIEPSRILLACGVVMGLLGLWTLTGGRCHLRSRAFGGPDRVGVNTPGRSESMPPGRLSGLFNSFDPDFRTPEVLRGHHPEHLGISFTTQNWLCRV